MDQIIFAAGDVKTALESKKYTVEMLPLTALNSKYAYKKLVLTLATNKSTSALLSTQGGELPTGLCEQGYGLKNLVNLRF